MEMDYRTNKGHRKMVTIVAGLALGLLSAGAFIAQAKDKNKDDGHHHHQIMWVNHMSLLSGDVSGDHLVRFHYLGSRWRSHGPWR